MPELGHLMSMNQALILALGLSLALAALPGPVFVRAAWRGQILLMRTGPGSEAGYTVAGLVARRGQHHKPPELAGMMAEDHPEPAP